MLLRWFTVITSDFRKRSKDIKRHQGMVNHAFWRDVFWCLLDHRLFLHLYELILQFCFSSSGFGTLVLVAFCRGTMASGFCCTYRGSRLTSCYVTLLWSRSWRMGSMRAFYKLLLVQACSGKNGFARPASAKPWEPWRPLRVKMPLVRSQSFSSLHLCWSLWLFTGLDFFSICETMTLNGSCPFWLPFLGLEATEVRFDPAACARVKSSRRQKVKNRQDGFFGGSGQDCAVGAH